MIKENNNSYKDAVFPKFRKMPQKFRLSKIFLHFELLEEKNPSEYFKILHS